MQPQTWHSPPLLPPPNSCCLAPHHRHVTALFHVIFCLWDDDRLAPHVCTEQISEATHLLPLAPAAMAGECIWYRCRSVQVCVYLCVCLTSIIQGIALRSISRSEPNGP